jgi:vanillate O-demethylase ferredoxin subunit
VIDVSAGQSMLDALLDAGIDVDHSCREGYCGTCLTRHIDGSPIHLDTCLSPADRTQYVAVCVSRALRESEIVLDI